MKVPGIGHVLNVHGCFWNLRDRFFPHRMNADLLYWGAMAMNVGIAIGITCRYFA